MKKSFILTCAITCLSLNACNTTSSQDWIGTTQGVLSSDGDAGVMGLFGLSGSSIAKNLTQGEISTALREALRISTNDVVSKLGMRDGFRLDPIAFIPLPSRLQKVDSALSKIGMNSLTESLETRLNHAAELATPKAKALFISAIQDMTLNDARDILNGPQDAATQYLRRSMGAQLKTEIQPIIQSTLAEAGAVQAYDQVMGRYAQIPFMPNVTADLNNYVSEKALDGIFYYVAQEEAAIRSNPAKRTTDILKKVFATH